MAIREAWFADSPPPADAAYESRCRAWVPNGERGSLARVAPTMRDGTGIDERVFVRGSHKTPGLSAAGDPRSIRQAVVHIERQRPARTGAAPHRARQPAGGAGDRQPAVAAPLRRGARALADDFGLQGQPPTHPELLDWLASEFVARGGLKAMHRLMVLSAAYRQRSRATRSRPRQADADPQNKLLHRQNVRRLEAEAMRDAMLAVSGRLDRTLEGPGVLPHLKEHMEGRGRPASGPLDGDGRRSIYLEVRRNFLKPMFIAFDYPTPFTTMGRRTVSNVPAQALVMLNNPFVMQQAELWAKRTRRRKRTRRGAVRAMYLIAFGRGRRRRSWPTARSSSRSRRRSTARRTSGAWADLATCCSTSRSSSS